MSKWLKDNKPMFFKMCVQLIGAATMDGTTKEFFSEYLDLDSGVNPGFFPW